MKKGYLLKQEQVCVLPITVSFSKKSEEKDHFYNIKGRWVFITCRECRVRTWQTYTVQWAKHIYNAHTLNNKPIWLANLLNILCTVEEITQYCNISVVISCVGMFTTTRYIYIFIIIYLVLHFQVSIYNSVHGVLNWTVVFNWYIP